MRDDDRGAQVLGIGVGPVSYTHLDVYKRQVHVQPKQLRDAVLLHGDAVQHIGLLHGAAAVRDDDELGGVADAPQILLSLIHI